MNSKSMCQRILWLTALLGGIALATWMTVLLFNTFLEHDIIARTTESSEVRPFPDVSFCNLNPVATELIHNQYSQYYNNTLLPVLHELTGNHFENIGGMLQAFDPSDTWMQILMDLVHVTGFFQNVDRDYIEANFENMDPRTVLPSCKYEPWTHTLSDNDFVERLQEDLTLSCGQLKFFFDQTYGPCATISLQNSDDIQRVRAMTAVAYLQDVNPYSGVRIESSPDITYGAGMAVLVHEHNTLPVMWNAIRIPLGFETTIHVDVTRRRRLEPPYESCEDTAQLEGDASFKYKRDTCIELCAQFETIEACGCLGYSSAITPSMRREYDFCGKINPQDMNQTLNLLSCSYYAGDLSCKCPESCDEYIYSTRVSQTVWPSRFSFYPAFRQYAMERIDDWQRFVLMNTSTTLLDGINYREFPQADYNMFRENFLQLNIVLSGINTTVVQSKPALSAVAIIGSLGGILNLWIGNEYYSKPA